MKPPAKESPAPVGSRTSSRGSAGARNGMAADAERAFAEEDGSSVLAVLDHQGLGTHGENLARSARQAGLGGKLL